jgi:hypothetical protein
LRYEAKENTEYTRTTLIRELAFFLSKKNMKRYKKTNITLVVGIAGIFVSGSVGVVVAKHILSVVESSNCGASVNFKSSPSSFLEFQIRKEPCSNSPETAAK